MPDHLDLDAFEAEIAVKPWNENLALKALAECRRLTDENARQRAEYERAFRQIIDAKATSEAILSKLREAGMRHVPSGDYQDTPETWLRCLTARIAELGG